ncbi:MAG: DNA mismatch endonuclease Vsr [Chloroflexus sp.]|nr:DNA mismatch endonuclease Vsr [Chloroflexus sp.]
MPDVFSPFERSRVMAKVRGQDTTPERTVRSLIHRMGYRFRLHVKDLPGKPDIVLPRYRKVIFVHGCFWHQHPGCPYAQRPSSNVEYWNRKLDRNVSRDRAHLDQLVYMGWQVLVIWECELRNLPDLQERLKNFILS